MSLHDELAAATPTGCRICHFVRGLDRAEASEWNRELALPVEAIGNEAVARALAARGVSLTEASVRRHRGKHV